MTYELLYIIPNQYTEEEAKKIKEKVDEALKGFGATLGLEEDMGKKKLAYPIDGSAHGYYFLREFTLELEDGGKIAEINDYLRLDKEVLRAQIVTKKIMSEKDLEKLRKREAHLAKINGEKAEDKSAKPVAGKSDDRKVDIKHLDEKIDEMLSTDDLV